VALDGAEGGLETKSDLKCYIKHPRFLESSGTMQFPSRGRRFVINPKAELYRQPLQFYGEPPLENISLSEFETFAVERLKRKTSNIVLSAPLTRISTCKDLHFKGLCF